MVEKHRLKLWSNKWVLSSLELSVWLFCSCFVFLQVSCGTAPHCVCAGAQNAKAASIWKFTTGEEIEHITYWLLKKFLLRSNIYICVCVYSVNICVYMLIHICIYISTHICVFIYVSIPNDQAWSQRCR